MIKGPPWQLLYVLAFCCQITLYIEFSPFHVPIRSNFLSLNFLHRSEYQISLSSLTNQYFTTWKTKSCISRYKGFLFFFFSFFNFLIFKLTWIYRDEIELYNHWLDCKSYSWEGIFQRFKFQTWNSARFFFPYIILNYRFKF